jgi:hypothetical protein
MTLEGNFLRVSLVLISTTPLLHIDVSPPPIITYSVFKVWE